MVPDRSPANVTYSISGQSAGKLDRSETVVAEKFARDDGGSFSNPVGF